MNILNLLEIVSAITANALAIVLAVLRVSRALPVRKVDGPHDSNGCSVC